jgi:hypothetical protein
MMGAGARFGCTKCMTQGEHVGRMVYHDYRHLLPTGHDFLTDPAFGKSVEPPVAPEMKTKELVEKLAQSVLRSGAPITGVKGHTLRHVHDTTHTHNTPTPSPAHRHLSISVGRCPFLRLRDFDIIRFAPSGLRHPSPCSLIHTTLRVDCYVGTLTPPCSLMCCAGTHPMTRCIASLGKSSTWLNS